MGKGYVNISLVWAERSITVSYQPNWLNLGQWHIELRCAEPLPVTATGYRSRFVPQDAFADEAEIMTFVTGWLDDTAKSKEWQTYLADSRQFKLF